MSGHVLQLNPLLNISIFFFRFDHNFNVDFEKNQSSYFWLLEDITIVYPRWLCRYLWFVTLIHPCIHCSRSKQHVLLQPWLYNAPDKGCSEWTNYLKVRRKWCIWYNLRQFKWLVIYEIWIFLDGFHHIFVFCLYQRRFTNREGTSH